METNKYRKGASIATQAKNLTEGCRCGIVKASRTNNIYNFTYGKSSEYAYAKCGHKTPNKFPEISGADGTVWNQEKYRFLEENYSDDSLQVHPALWNDGTNNLLSGVFEVLEGKIYQVRGYDMANITFVKTNFIENDTLSGDEHWLVMDTLMSEECTKKALLLFNDFLYKSINNKETETTALNEATYLYKKIDAMIISHSHVDHYGGMSVVMECLADSKAGDVDFSIIVPKNFTEHAVSENVYVGNAMGRRASYQYGSFIQPNGGNENCCGSISIGIGQGQSTGTIGFEMPTYEVTSNEKLQIKELEIVCQLTPGTEAPAEMNNYFPGYKALWLAENCTGTLHNLYTLRGAQVRDGKDWAKFLVEAAVEFGQEAEVIFQSHNWPHWKNMTDGTAGTNIREFLLETASIYKYINDQTLYYMNKGYKMNEAADMLTIPRKLQKNWCTMPFYGTPKHNAKAVYQKYLGWYDANPLHLEELPPEQMAKEIMRYMNNAEGKDVLTMVKEDYDLGNYWIAAYMAHQIILSGSGNVGEAKNLCADALEQLGYQAQSGTWRNAYLCAAYELRNGKGRVSASKSSDTLNYMTSEMLLDYIAILFDGERASSKIKFDGKLIVTTDNNLPAEEFALVIRNGAIMYYPLAELSVINCPQIGAEIITIKKDTLIKMILLSQDSELSDWDVYQKLLKLDNANAEFLKKIVSCMVNLSVDRYKYFDIMGRHDSEVEIQGISYDLKSVVLECIELLSTYEDSVKNLSGSMRLKSSDFSKWQEYYSMLKVNSNVILEGDFITADNNDTLGIGKDGLFKAQEYWYTMYSLYRYLGKSYVNNDCHFQYQETYDREYRIETLTKLKKQIQLLESYVPDLYLEGDVNFGKNKYRLDSGDKNAWLYICGEDFSFIEEFYAGDIFKKLYECYKQLVNTLGI